MSLLAKMYSPDIRLPFVAIIELSCGHRLIVDTSTDAARNGLYGVTALHCPDIPCQACAENYQRVKTVKAWPNGIDLLLACGHLNAGRPYVLNIDPRTANVYKDTDVFCDVCSLLGDQAFT